VRGEHCAPRQVAEVERLGAIRGQVADADDVPGRLRHFRVGERQELAVQPDVYDPVAERAFVF